MKKTIFLSIIISLILATSGFALAAELEKVPSPDQIKNFRIIKKEGNTLFGFRLGQKASGTAATGTILISSSTSPILEKISHPSQIGLFEKIRKIGTALWGVRKNTGNATSTKPVLVEPAAVQCVKDAIDKKDAAVKTAIASSSQSIIAAIDVRNACQKAALDKTTGQEQFDTNRLCVSAYQKSIKDTNETLKNAKKGAWETYRDDLKKCSALQKASHSTSTADVNSEIIITDGEN